ncbi:MAG: NAD+ synthase [Acidobacteria bacterium]|nr:MAG: NAD+ synthase [Acidobacteriota bacterium]
MKIALAQLNLAVGDLDRNASAICSAIADARAGGADLVALPELATTGYPPEDLLLKADFVAGNLESLEEIASAAVGITAIVGFVSSTGSKLGNSAAICRDGKVESIYTKQVLPNYGVFDEQRWFTAGSELVISEIAGLKCGVSICEDIWSSEGPARRLAAAGAEVLININASPFHRNKGQERRELLERLASETGLKIGYVNLVGGQDELVFDGGSIFAAPDLVARAEQFREELLFVEVDRGTAGGPMSADPDPVGEVYRALELGTRDYIEKNGFAGVVVGLSGGVDSALTATIAVDAIGSDRVVGVTMPSRYTSTATRDDALELAARLGIRLIELPIEGPFQAYLDALAEVFEDRTPDVTEENLQARIRGNYLMALSNKFGWLVLATGNKSEMAVGYSTLYGDLAGGFALIKDVPKTLVYELARFRNGGEADTGPIPLATLERPPSAELRPDQLDEDSLPPYAILDPILERYVELDMDSGAIVDDGFDPGVVERVITMVDRAEYKRRQSPPGIKITRKAFGRDRRLPITNHYIGTGRETAG